MKRFALALLASVLTAVYWWVVFTIVYADVLFAGDRNPARPPAADRDVVLGNAAAIIAGVLAYALLVLLWQRLAYGLRRAN